MPETGIRGKGASGGYAVPTLKRAILVLLLAPCAAVFADPAKDWSKAQKSVDRREREFWDKFKSRFNDALKSFSKPVDDARDKPNVPANKEAVYNYDDVTALYDNYEQILNGRGVADQVFADTGDAKAAAMLLAALLADAKKIDKLDADLHDSKPDYGRYTYRQEAGVRLYGMRIARAQRIAALGKASGAVEFLTGDGWKRASKGDGRKSFQRRVALLDALAAAGDEAAIEFLTQISADESPAAVRIAATEALTAFGPKAAQALAARLLDEDAAVRRALLLRWTRPDQARPEWFTPTIEHLARARGVERDLCVRVLAAISKQTFGHDYARWREWYGEYKGELESGKFDPKNVEVVEAKPKPDPDAASFYNIPLSATGIIFVIEASRQMAMPANVDVQRTKWRDEWIGMRNSWEKEHEAQQTVVVRQLERTSEAFSPDMRWGLITLSGPFNCKTEGEKRLLKADKKSRRAALKLVQKAEQKGWCAPYQGLRVAAAMGGKESATIDTIVLWGTGDPAGGRFMCAKAAAAAWLRFNRFRCLRVDAVRIANRKNEAETFMTTIANASGGTYLWAKKPPGD